MHDRYLWDRTGPADPEVERLEALLGRFRDIPPLRLASKRRFPSRALLAAVALLLAVAGAAWFARSVLRLRWRIESIEGRPLVGPRPVSGDAALSAGQRIETDAASKASLGLGGIARISLGSRSRLRLISSGLAEVRLALDRGTMTARISAPPRLFVVETPSALAVDLGCSYTLDVDPSGAGVLRVETGWVSFERDGRESVVPAGAACKTRPKEGPGTPYYDDAAPELRLALERLDFDGEDEDALSTILGVARKRDGLTLWHLLTRSLGSDRERVYERLAALVPPPPEVTREGALAGDLRMLARWRWELGGVPMPPESGNFWSFWRRVWFRLTAF
jgi:hypothetical protein